MTSYRRAVNSSVAICSPGIPARTRTRTRKCTRVQIPARIIGYRYEHGNGNPWVHIATSFTNTRNLIHNCLIA